MIVLTKLFLAHIVGDFILQPSSWVKEKQIKKLRSPKLYIHAILHGLLAIVLIWDINFLPWALLLLLTHFLIDAVKILFETPNTSRFWFITDQLLHLIAVAVIWFLWKNPSIQLANLRADYLLLLTSVIFLTNPSSVIIKTLISQWSPTSLKNDAESLPDAGKYIGILERLFVLAFIITNHWEAVGFLLAAKSVFRFGDLKDAHDRKLTEYVLIGTLLSFGIAISVSLITSFLLVNY